MHRITTIIAYYPALGGAQTNAAELSAKLLAGGHDVCVLTLDWTGTVTLAERLRGIRGDGHQYTRRWKDSGGVPVISFGGRVGSVRWRPLFGLAVARHFLASRGPGVAHFHMIDSTTPFSALVAKGLGRKVVVMLACGGELGEVANARRSLLGWWHLRAILRIVDRVIVLNEAMRRELMDLGVPESKLVMLWCAVDPNVFTPLAAREKLALRRKEGIPEQCLVTIHVGRLHEQKRVDTLIDAHAKTDGLLVIAGDGPLEAELRVRARPLGDRVRFVGRLDRAGVVRWLQASDVFTLVSSSEGSPCALLEAMAAELPCVVTSIPGNSDHVRDGVHGLHVPVGDIERIRGALLRLAREPQTRIALGRAGRKRIVDELSGAEALRRYETMYRELMVE